MDVSKLTHDEIADIAAKKLRTMGYPLAFSNMTSATCGEQPDALGLNAYAESILIEVKVSRSDFLADKKKVWRQPGKGIGLRRVYLTTKGLIKTEEVPYGWELWEVHGTAKPMIKVIKGRIERTEKREGMAYPGKIIEFKECDLEEWRFFKKQENHDYREEAMWLIKILRRAKEAGVDVESFANRKPFSDKETGL